MYVPGSEGIVWLEELLPMSFMADTDSSRVGHTIGTESETVGRQREFRLEALYCPLSSVTTPKKSVISGLKCLTGNSL